jgi:hypothetical protein
MDGITILKVLTMLSKEAGDKRRYLETLSFIEGNKERTETEILTIVDMMDKIASLVK